MIFSKGFDEWTCDLLKSRCGPLPLFFRGYFWKYSCEHFRLKNQNYLKQCLRCFWISSLSYLHREANHYLIWCYFDRFWCIEADFLAWVFPEIPPFLGTASFEANHYLLQAYVNRKTHAKRKSWTLRWANNGSLISSPLQKKGARVNSKKYITIWKG